MTNSNSGYAGVVGALILCGALAGCVDNGNDVGFEELPNGGPPPSENAAVATTASGGSGTGGGPADTSGGDASNVVTTGSGGGSAGTSGGDAANVVTGSGGGSAGTSGGDAANVVTGTGGGPADTSGSDAANVVTGTGGGPADTSGGDSDGTTGAGGAPAETTPCGPDELSLNCEYDEICRGVETSGPAQYSCEPNPCFEHNQANSCECAASLCGSEAPNCVMLEDDTVVACVCVFC